MATKQIYAANGVTLSKTSICEGDKITVYYDGLLVGCGAVEVHLHLGYGENWDDKEFIQMINEDGVFKADIHVKRAGVLNMAFKDGIENWDNNSFNNYSFPVKESKTVEKKVSKTDAKSSSSSTKNENKASSKSSSTAKKVTSAAKKEADSEKKQKAEKAPKTKSSAKAVASTKASATSKVSAKKTTSASKTTKKTAKK